MNWIRSILTLVLVVRTFDRDEFNQLINQVKQGGIRQIMVSELSRLGRNMLELLKTIEILKEHNTNLVVIKEGIDLSKKSSELFIHLLGVLSNYELSLLKDRISSVLKLKRTTINHIVEKFMVLIELVIS